MLEAQITELAGHLNAGNHRFLVLTAEFDRRKGWATAGCNSCAHWLNLKCGIDMGAAREKVRVANALEGLPQISAAMARGQLSYSKVRAITRVARPETEELLLMIALHGTAHHVETTVRTFRRCQQAEELSREARQQATRALHYNYDDNGSLIIRASLPAEVGALFVKAINAAVEAADRPTPAGAAGGTSPSRKAATRPNVSAETSASASHVARDIATEARPSAGGHLAQGVSAETRESTPASESPTPGERPSWAMRRADALGRMVESFMAHGAEVMSGGDRQQIVVHVDAQTLRDGGSGRCEHEDGPAMPVETARRLACDASVVPIVEGEDGETLNVGRKTRTISPALRRALNSRDRCCRFPGCSNKHYVDGHHIKHWADDGETKLSNLVLLCRFHHRFVHEGGVTIQVLNDGALRFKLKDGRALDSLRPAQLASADAPLAEDIQQGDWMSLHAAHDATDVHITPTTAVTRWLGESCDYSTIIQAMFHRMRHAEAQSLTPQLAQNVSAETPRIHQACVH